MGFSPVPSASLRASQNEFLMNAFEPWEEEAILKDKYPFHFALDQGDSKKVRSYLKQNPAEDLSQKDALGLDAWDHANLCPKSSLTLIHTLLKSKLKKKLIQKTAINALNVPSTPFKIEGARASLERIEAIQKLSEKSFENETSAPLFRACLQKDFGSVHRLLEENPDWIHAVTQEEGYTPLHLASFSGDVKTIQFLLKKHGLSGDFFSLHQKTPLHMAAIGGHKEAVKQLIHAGFSPNTPDLKRCTPLHDALLARNVDTASFLIEQGADASALNQYNVSPFEAFGLSLQINKYKPFELDPKSYSKILRLILFWLFSSFSSYLEEKVSFFPSKAFFAGLMAFGLDGFFEPSFLSLSKDLPEKARPIFELFCRFASAYIPFLVDSSYESSSSPIVRLFIRASASLFLFQEMNSNLLSLTDTLQNVQKAFRQREYSLFHALKNGTAHLINGVASTLFSLSYLKSAYEIISEEKHFWKGAKEEVHPELLAACGSEETNPSLLPKALNYLDPTSEKYRNLSTRGASSWDCPEIHKIRRILGRAFHSDKNASSDNTLMTCINRASDLAKQASGCIDE